MSLTVVTPPASTALTTDQRAADELGLSGSTDNLAILHTLIDQASRAIARECGRPYFGVGTYTETLNGTGSQLLAVTCVPIVAITTLYQDTELLAALDPTIPANQTQEGYYVEDAEAGAIYRAAGWGQTVALMSWGWEAYASRYILPGGTLIQRYTVTYQAGWQLPYDAPTSGAAIVPGELERACLETVKQWWHTLQRDYTISGVQVGEVRVQYAAAMAQSAALPAIALGLIRNYRRVA